MPLSLHKHYCIVGRKSTAAIPVAGSDTDHTATATATATDSMDPLLAPPPPPRARPASPPKIFVVDAATTLLWAAFRVLECVLWIPALVWLRASHRRRAAAGIVATRTIVVVGGNFAGLAALWELLAWQRKRNKAASLASGDNTAGVRVRVVLIDRKDYSEYTPGILRLFCEPGYFFRLAQSLPESSEEDGFRRIHGTVTSIVGERGADERGTSHNPTRTTEASEENVEKVLTYLPSCNGAETAAATTTKTLRYDYLILATGAAYHAPISPAAWSASASTNGTADTSQATSPNMLDRYREWKTAHERLKGAKRVLILGGGAVGVELAAEIIDHDPPRSNGSGGVAVTILDAQPTLVPLFPRSVGAYAEDWLTRRGAELRLGESLRSWNDRSCTLADGTVLHADVVYVCFGNRPNSEAVGASSSSGAASSGRETRAFFSLTKRRTVSVRDTLQLCVGPAANDGRAGLGVPDGTGETRSTTPWFACGDVASPPTNDEKQAFQAEMQGKVAARNAIRLLESSLLPASAANGARLLRYPLDIAGADRIPLVFVLSLGRYDGVLGFNHICIPGPLAAVVKWILEYTKVSHMRGRLLGNLVWKIGDAVTLFLSRTVLRPASPVPPTAEARAIASANTNANANTNTQRSLAALSNTTDGGKSSSGGPIQRTASSASLYGTRQQRQLEQQLKLS
ncbi:unnamed protein product [Pseudo-nitzschia multistriata]|uniref:FAD/NAD(P)-binding domain-containing protein n=1 Tax=Pseudo-nitzschia multistriata TaxID=183589 RepID=A0A448YV54_9STRA|nr:unnamed protein product [Pseudo-nitzschia multistriata]